MNSAKIGRRTTKAATLKRRCQAVGQSHPNPVSAQSPCGSSRHRTKRDPINNLFRVGCSRITLHSLAGCFEQSLVFAPRRRSICRR